MITNGSVILERASLRPIQKILRGPLGPVVARFANRRMFTRGFARLFTDKHPLSSQEAEAQWALMACNDGANDRPSADLLSRRAGKVRIEMAWRGK